MPSSFCIRVLFCFLSYNIFRGSFFSRTPAELNCRGSSPLKLSSCPCMTDKITARSSACESAAATKHTQHLRGWRKASGWQEQNNGRGRLSCVHAVLHNNLSHVSSAQGQAERPRIGSLLTTSNTPFHTATRTSHSQLRVR